MNLVVLRSRQFGFAKRLRILSEGWRGLTGRRALGRYALPLKSEPLWGRFGFAKG